MLLLKNLKLVDSKHPLNLKKIDILIDNKKIKIIDLEIVNTFNCQEIDFKGAYVSSGWVDLHVHCFKDETDLGVDIDRIGVDSGVVCIVDAGSSGEKNIDSFYKQTLDKKTIVKAFINIGSTGLINRYELKDPSNINVEKTIAKIKQYKDFVVGIKLRASASVMGQDIKTPFKKAKEIKRKISLPMMVHFGNFPPKLEDIMSYMEKEDILTHCFNGKPNGIINEHISIKEIILSKRKEGIRYDVGHGQDSFSIKVASISKNNKFNPDSLSTDLHKYNIDGPVYSLANVVNKFIHLGYGLNEIIDMVTINPAKMIGLKEIDNLKNDSLANLTFFKICDEEKTLVDSNGNKIKVNKVVKMVGTLIEGEYSDVKYEN